MDGCTCTLAMGEVELQGLTMNEWAIVIKNIFALLILYFQMMKNIRDSLKMTPKHCAPSNADEIKQYLRLPQACFHNIVE